MMGIDKFYQYLRHCPKFVIKTDSLALTFLDKMSRPSAQFKRWQYELANLNFTIEHVKGKYNVVADCLSRNPDFIKMKDTNDEEISDICERIIKLRSKNQQITDTLTKIEERNKLDQEYLEKVDKSQEEKLKN